MKITFTIFLFLSMGFTLFSQQKKYMYFDEKWQISKTEDTRVYTCDCYIDEFSKLIGKFSCYHDSLKILVKEYFFNKDVLNGPVKEYYLNGKLKLSAQYENGFPINQWIEYDEAGNVVLEKTFEDQSKIKDYYSEETPYNNALAFSHKKEEPPIYTSECLRIKIEQQRIACSEAALQAYIDNPPLPKDAKYQGQIYECLLQYVVSDKGLVDKVSIIKSTGDAFLDLLAEAHLLNMMPFEAAKKYGVPVEATLDAQIIFKF